MSDGHCTIGSDRKEAENEKHDTTHTRFGWEGSYWTYLMVYNH